MSLIENDFVIFTYRQLRDDLAAILSADMLSIILCDFLRNSFYLGARVSEGE